MKRVVWHSIVIASLLAASSASAGFVFFNEIRKDQTGTDTDEYVELFGAPGFSFIDIQIVVLGDGSADSGEVEAVWDLDGVTMPGDGYLVVGSSAMTLATPDVVVGSSNILENGDNMTFLLVAGMTGSAGDDLDTNDDGVLDSTPWTAEFDRIAMIEEENPPSGTVYHYGPPTVGPDGSFAPGHVYLCGATWLIGSFTSILEDTPGAANPCGGGADEDLDMGFDADAGFGFDSGFGDTGDGGFPDIDFGFGDAADTGFGFDSAFDVALPDGFTFDSGFGDIGFDFGFGDAGDFGFGDAGDFGFGDAGDFGFGDIGDLGFGDIGDFGFGDVGDFDFGGGDFGFGDIGDFGFGDVGDFGFGDADLATDDFGFGDAGDFGFGDADFTFDADLEDLAVDDLGGDVVADADLADLADAGDFGLDGEVAPDADAGTPDTGTPDTGTPDTGTPDTGTPDTGTPDTGIDMAADAGTDAQTDGGADTGSGGDVSNPEDDGGCDCSTTGPRRVDVPMALSVAFVLGLAVLPRRRQRRS